MCIHHHTGAQPINIAIPDTCDFKTTGTTSQLIVKNGAVLRRPSSSSGEQQADNDDDDDDDYDFKKHWLLENQHTQ